MNPALCFENVTITYRNGHRAARDVSFEIDAGECLALVGESGCGKTTMAKAALGLLPKGTNVGGSIHISDVQTTEASEHALRNMRGLLADYVEQAPFSACDPLRPVGDHVAEAWRVHGVRPPAGAVASLLARLGIADPEEAARRYPHQWSGGMLQRAVIAAASAHRPYDPTSNTPRCSPSQVMIQETAIGCGGVRMTLWHNIDRRFISMGATGWHCRQMALFHHAFSFSKVGKTENDLQTRESGMVPQAVGNTRRKSNQWS